MCRLTTFLDELEDGLAGGGALGADDVDGLAVDEAVAEEADPVALAEAQGDAGQGRRHLSHLIVQAEAVSNLLDGETEFNMELIPKINFQRIF